jgi:acyl-coenzyme A thioesterase PaaI-like protein
LSGGFVFAILDDALTLAIYTMHRSDPSTTKPL